LVDFGHEVKVPFDGFTLTVWSSSSGWRVAFTTSANYLAIAGSYRIATATITALSFDGGITGPP
jgi:hypothetical protein